VGPALDPRVQRTRTALVRAFNTLLLSKGYDAANPAAIAELAKVGRSTFYDHYTGKEDLLAQSLAVVLRPIADAVSGDPGSSEVEFVLAHFWENRRLARALMTGRARAIMVRELSRLVEVSLRRQRRREALIPPLAAAHLAHGALGLINEWLTGHHGGSAGEIAGYLQRGASPATDATG
jgi:AcrR family transcriptional regulator